MASDWLVVVLPANHKQYEKIIEGRNRNSDCVATWLFPHFVSLKYNHKYVSRL